jgi:hypothetical protein
MIAPFDFASAHHRAGHCGLVLSDIEALRIVCCTEFLSADERIENAVSDELPALVTRPPDGRTTTCELTGSREFSGGWFSS